MLADIRAGGAVDNEEAALRRGAEKLGVNLSPSATAKLLLFARELKRWSAKVPLVSRRSLSDLLEKHVLDSLALSPDLSGAESVIDIGSGGGFPGIPLKVQSPSLTVVLVESSAKKAAFLRHVAARLDLGGLSIHSVRAAGKPDFEGLPRSEVVISRAFAPLPSWLALGLHYLRPGGRVFAMLAQDDDAALEQAAVQAGAKLLSVRRFSLPFSGASRAIATFNPR
jgi:16S rRNA (guanine527-N7)-methyltransferase